MADHRLTSKISPPTAAPVVHGQVRYSVGPRRQTANWYQMGYVEARDTRTNALLWELMVYEVDYAPDRETDVQEVYITSLRIVDGELEVVNERGGTYRVDLSGRSVRKL